MNTCVTCGNSFEGRPTRKYCSNQCQGDERRAEATAQWLRKEIPGHAGTTLLIKRFVRAYMLEKAGHKCSKCGWNTPHPVDKKPPLDINHIDGDASNTWEENLEVLCPNCHALTPNYKNRNRCGKRKR